MADTAHEKALEAAYKEFSLATHHEVLDVRAFERGVKAYLAAADLVPRMPEIHEQARLIGERDAMRAVVDAARNVVAIPRSWDELDALETALTAYDKETGGE